MEVLKRENKVCLSCMESHEVLTVKVQEKNIFKGKEVKYIATYEYCENTQEFYASEEQISQNDIAMKIAYREIIGLLTPGQINAIRCKYGISQSDLSVLLGWGAKTITRYEGYHVQDMAHDSILRKIDADPAWYLELLEASKDKFSPSTYKKYKEAALQLFEKNQNEYLRKTIMAAYARYVDSEECTGGKLLDLDKVIDVVRYFANSVKVKSLYKVKLMKLLWYADAFSYKTRGSSMTGLVYRALPMGAVPVSHEHIIDLRGINYEEIYFEDSNGYRFIPDNNNNYPNITDEDKAILDYVIDCFGDVDRKEIVEVMHREVAYTETAPNDIIQYKYAKELSI